MRWADSDIRICRSRVFPWICLGVFPLSFSLSFSLSFGSCWLLVGGDRMPHPRMVPMLILGHALCSCGHISLAIDHICLRGVAWQFTSICSIDSVTPHIVQSSCCSLFGMFLQN